MPELSVDMLTALKQEHAAKDSKSCRILFVASSCFLTVTFLVIQAPLQWSKRWHKRGWNEGLPFTNECQFDLVQLGWESDADKILCYTQRGHASCACTCQILQQNLVLHAAVQPNFLQWYYQYWISWITRWPTQSRDWQKWRKRLRTFRQSCERDLATVFHLRWLIEAFLCWKMCPVVSTARNGFWTISLTY